VLDYFKNCVSQRLDQSSGDNVIQTRNIKVVDWAEDVDDIMEVIAKK